MTNDFSSNSKNKDGLNDFTLNAGVGGQVAPKLPPVQDDKPPLYVPQQRTLAKRPNDGGYQPTIMARGGGEDSSKKFKPGLLGLQSQTAGGSDATNTTTSTVNKIKPLAPVNFEKRMPLEERKNNNEFPLH